jgi:RimJ/RimL family protein N-acetyltransferase
MAHVLETERLLLRMFPSDDADSYYAMCSEPEVMVPRHAEADSGTEVEA